MFSWGINSLTFSSQQTIGVEPNSLFILTGPNSSGKSTALRDLARMLEDGGSGKVIQRFERYSTGNVPDFLNWLKQRGIVSTFSHAADRVSYLVPHADLHFTDPPNEEETPYGPSERIRLEIMLRVMAGTGHGDLISKWPYYDESPKVDKLLFNRLDTESRLTLGNSRPRVDLHSGPAEYIHLLQMDDARLSVVSKEVRNAFGVDLLVNHGGASQVWFHVGEAVKPTSGEDRVSRSYLARLRKLPRLEEEGDGIRSFVGILLAMVCGPQPLLLIDEPEAFLHPRQAERLGALLAQNARDNNRQVIVATHSPAFVRGALDNASNVVVCRIIREGDENYASVLTSARIQELWSKPTLRTASALEGIFARGVIVCEGDTDTRFYSALLKAAEEKSAFQQPADVYVTNAGGKGEQPTLAKAYRSLGIPVAVISDLDLLRQRGQFAQVLESLGGTIDAIQGSYNSAVSGLNDVPPVTDVETFAVEIRIFLSKVEAAGSVTSADKQAFLRLISDAAPWSEASKYGVAKLRGGTHQAAMDVLAYCHSLGLFLVPSGTLESWWRGGPVDKTEWCLTSVARIYSEECPFPEADAFIKQVTTFLNVPLAVCD